MVDGEWLMENPSVARRQWMPLLYVPELAMISHLRMFGSIARAEYMYRIEVYRDRGMYLPTSNSVDNVPIE